MRAMRSELTDVSFNSDLPKEILAESASNVSSNYASCQNKLAKISEETVVEVPKIAKQRTEDKQEAIKEETESESKTRSSSIM